MPKRRTAWDHPLNDYDLNPVSAAVHRGCDGKIGYPSKKNASGVARSLGSATLAAYRCPGCGRWHIGHSRWRDGKDASPRQTSPVADRS